MEEKKNLWSSYDEAAKKELHEINEKYKACSVWAKNRFQTV